MSYLEGWEPVIGLEIHAQLNSKSLMFGPAPNQFGDEPNINLDFLNTGQPGALPVINQIAVKKAVSFGLAVDATINLCSVFDRKSYFYPDCPLNYQITQFYKPIITGGEIITEVEGQTKTFQIHHAHLENDAGKLIHFPEFTGVDFNRSGAPLLEIVSDPCMHSSKDAASYGQAVKAILEYIDSSVCNMQEGHFRMDANISVRKKGEKELRTKTEIKNMNSFFNMELAIESEIRRQIEFYSNHPDKKLISGTYRFDLENRKTILMRTKESADDYRYFPEPDLPPLILTKKFVDDIKEELPELPRAKFQRYVDILGLSAYSSSLLVNDKPLCDDFEEGLKIAKNPKLFCNWLTVEFIGRIKESGKTLHQIGIDTKQIAELINLIEDGTITGRIAKSVADDMLKMPGKSPSQIVKENPDYLPLKDTSIIEPIVDKVLALNENSITDYKNGRDKALQYLIGQVMKECKGKATPDLTRDLILKKIAAL